MIPFVDIESDAVMKFSEIDRADMHRTPVALIQMIGTVHQAIKKDAMLDSEHVAGFMRKNLATSTENDSIPV